MAEFLIQRSRVLEQSVVILQVDKPSTDDMLPFVEICSACPVNFTKMAYGCTKIVFYNGQTRAIMQTVSESECGIINSPDNTFTVSERS